MRLWRRSLTASVVTTGLDVALFALCTVTLAKHQLTAARAACALIGAVANFVLNQLWAFRPLFRCGTWRSWRVGRYAITALAAVTLGTLSWHLLWRTTGADPRLLQLVSMAGVWLVFTFPLFRGWVFSARSNRSSRTG